MTEITRAVVIHTFSYSDTSLILKAYTEKFGYTSYLLKGYKKRKKDKVLLSPFSLIEIGAVHKSSTDLHMGRSVNSYRSVQNIAINPVKSSIAMFLAEWLFHTVRIGEPDEAFFNWLIQAVERLDQSDYPVNFHLWFLLKLSDFMGFYPQGKKSIKTPIFNLTEGEYTSKSTPGDLLSAEESEWLDLIMNGNYESIKKLKLNRLNRRKILRFFHDYFQICLNSDFRLNSFDILLQIFDD
jgi:DNA repair protein RecO (recombination protein O)